ncbi:hypothetical protein LEP1GSC036_4773 [Leptospira weilii str. 2006001853]|uniref:Uncharacterized protein n=1 Tax=Leptospira weilii str. 2006001853 TaxID=1001589 RepID=A0A828Z0D5_9LEPT|nr:hypothetical protein LEP1GSC036_4773 [Leptospira weilii str. 2006001853]
MRASNPIAKARFFCTSFLLVLMIRQNYPLSEICKKMKIRWKIQ